MTTFKMKRGWLLRQHASTLDKVPARVEQTLAWLTQLRKAALQDDVVILVPTDKDCGETAQSLTAAVQKNGFQRQVVILAVSGSPNTTVLNDGVAHLHQNDCTHVCIVSGKAQRFITTPVLVEIIDAVTGGAKVVGVAVDVELTNRIAAGFVLNTFAVWEINALLQAGGFTVEHDSSKGGVEEVAPLVGIVRNHPASIAVLIPKLDDLHPGLVIVDHDRLAAVRADKLERQNDILTRLQVDEEYLRPGLMRGYPKQLK